MSYQPDTLIDNRYRLVRVLGAGGMGEVWIAHQASLDRDVALKLMKGDDPELVARFSREARAVSRVHHDNVVVVHDTGTCATTGASFIAMELIEGESLRALASRGAVPVDRALEILRHVLAGLAAAHGAGIVHRDIKPENVMLANTAHGMRAKLVDFGIARTAGAGETLTVTGSFVGTPGYTAPEVALGAPNNNAKGDLYAVGCIAFELLSGRPVFEGANSLAVAMKHVNETAPALVRPDVPPHVVALVARMLDKEPARRPTALDALRALDSSVAGPTPQRTPVVSSPIATPQRASVITAASAATATQTAAQVQLTPAGGGDAWVRVSTHPLVTVDVHVALRVVRFTRTHIRTVGLELDELYRSLLDAPGGIDPASGRLLVDYRLAPPRNDAAFEAKVNQWLDTLATRYQRMAVLVKTATGRLQASRNMRDHGQQVFPVYQDYDEALRSLTG